MVKLIAIVICLFVAVLPCQAAEFDANSDGVFDSTFKVKVDNLVHTATTAISANVVTLLTAADFAGMRTSLSLVPGTNVQAYDADLTNWAGITAPTIAAAGDILVGSGANAATVITKGSNNTIFGVNGSGTLGFYTTMRLDDSAAQFNDATDPTKLLLIELGGLPTSTTAFMRPIEEIHVTVVKPQDMADAVRDAFLVWSNESGKSFIITGWKAWAGADDTSLNIEETDADGANNATVDAVEIATGSGPYTAADTTITGATIEAGHLIWLDFDDTDDPSYVKLVIYGYYAN